MSDDEKAKIILEALGEYLQIDSNFEKYYMKGIKNGLKEIERREEHEKAQDANSDDHIGNNFDHYC